MNSRITEPNQIQMCNALAFFYNLMKCIMVHEMREKRFVLIKQCVFVSFSVNGIFVLVFVVYVLQYLTLTG